MKGVMLVDMGGPNSPEELRNFLSRMFMDPFILPYSRFVRRMLSFVISRSRYKKSWKKYQLIGGTPLVQATIKTAKSLQTKLGADFEVKYAFSYSSPDIARVMNEFKEMRVREITIIPLYPQSSYTTTSSVKAEIFEISKRDSFYNTKFRKEFYTHPGFIDFWIQNIARHIEENNIQHPTLIFSAHSIPKYNILKGDTYSTSIINSAALIAGKMGLQYEVAFQSRMRNGTWIGPDTKEHLSVLAGEGIDNLVLIPISFIHENLETRYDLDFDLIPFAKNVLGFKNITRVQLPEADPLLIGMLAKLVQTS
jgi:ferrochelatase